MKTLTHYGMMLVKNHDTTLDEIERVCLVDQTIDDIENEIKEENKKMSSNLSLDPQANALIITLPVMIFIDDSGA